MATGVFRTRAWIRRRPRFLPTAVAVAAAASLTPAPRDRPRRALKSRRRHGLAAAGVSTKAAALPLAKGAVPIRRPQVRRRVGRALVASKTPAAAPTSLAPDVRRLPIRAEQRRRPRRTGRLPGVAVAAPQLSLTSRSGPRRKPAAPANVPRAPRFTASVTPAVPKSAPLGTTPRPLRTALPRVRRSRPAPATRAPVVVTSAPLRRAPWARRRPDVWMMRRRPHGLGGAGPVVGTGQACFGDFGVVPQVEARLRVGDAVDVGLIVLPAVNARLHVGC